MCVVKLGSFHGCFFCKVNQRGCSLCPKALNEKGEMVNIRKKSWCWFVTLVHHIASILEMEDPEGPISILPSYDGVQFPTFDKSLAKLIKKFKTTMTDDLIKSKWEEIKNNPPQPYYGVPHKKLLSLEHRTTRGRFPIVGTGREVEHKLCDILRNAGQGKLPRLWAVGYKDVWTRSNEDAHIMDEPEEEQNSASRESTAVSIQDQRQAARKGRGNSESDDEGRRYITLGYSRSLTMMERISEYVRILSSTGLGPFQPRKGTCKRETTRLYPNPGADRG